MTAMFKVNDDSDPLIFYSLLKDLNQDLSKLMMIFMAKFILIADRMEFYLDLFREKMYLGKCLLLILGLIEMIVRSNSPKFQ